MQIKHINDKNIDKRVIKVKFKIRKKVFRIKSVIIDSTPLTITNPSLCSPANFTHDKILLYRTQTKRNTRSTLV